MEHAPEQVDVIHCADARDMHHLPDNSVHLMITSPPYNVGKDYDDDLSLSEYRDLLSEVLQETYRTLVQGGRACVNIANVGRTPYIPMHVYIMDIARECGFQMRGEIIWDKGASAGSSCAWGSWRSASNPVLRDVHEYILVFCKDAYKRRVTGENSVGRDEFLEYTKSIWRFPSGQREKGQPPRPLPRRASAETDQPVLVCRRHRAGPVHGLGHDCRGCSECRPPVRRLRNQPGIC